MYRFINSWPHLSRTDSAVYINQNYYGANFSCSVGRKAGWMAITIFFFKRHGVLRIPPTRPSLQLRKVHKNKQPGNFYYGKLSNFLSLIPIFFRNAQDIYHAEPSHNSTLAEAPVAAVDKPRPSKKVFKKWSWQMLLTYWHVSCHSKTALERSGKHSGVFLPSASIVKLQLQWQCKQDVTYEQRVSYQVGHRKHAALSLTKLAYVTTNSFLCQPLQLAPIPGYCSNPPAPACWVKYVPTPTEKCFNIVKLSMDQILYPEALQHHESDKI